MLKQKAWMKIHQKRLLDRGKIERLVGALRSIESDNPEVAKKIRTEADYFERNRERIGDDIFPRLQWVHRAITGRALDELVDQPIAVANQ